MRIVDLAGLYEQPWGTLFQTYAPGAVGPLEVFEGPCPQGDYLSEPLNDPQPQGAETYDDFAAAFSEAVDTGSSFPVTYGQNLSRDCARVPGQLFAVYEKHDVERLMEYLQMQLVRAY